MSSPIRDLIDLLHEDWLPDEHKNTLKGLIIELIENMSEDQNETNNRWGNW
jgi:Mg2+/Co2+ transporter CorB